MSDYDDTNSGVLFQNDKEGNDKRPDYKGKINVEGAEFEIAGWKRVAKSSGKPFLSLKIQESKNEGYNSFKQQGEQLKAKQESSQVESDDEPINISDIPF